MNYSTKLLGAAVGFNSSLDGGREKGASIARIQRGAPSRSRRTNALNRCAALEYSLGDQVSASRARAARASLSGNREERSSSDFRQKRSCLANFVNAACLQTH